MILMGHKDFGFNHFADGFAEEAKKAGWFAVDDLVKAKAEIYQRHDAQPEEQQPASEVVHVAPRRGRKPKAH